MFLVDQLAEAHIRKAIERGDLDDLPGAGKPLYLDDDVCVPQELRVAYRILKNAGYAPPDVMLRREIRQIEQLLYRIDDSDECIRMSKRLSLLRVKLGDHCMFTSDSQYFSKLVQKF